mgnify:CR=1 FL=1
MIRQYRWMVLGPLAVVLVVLVAAGTGAILWQAHGEFRRLFGAQVAAVQSSWQTVLNREAAMLGAPLEALKRDATLRQLYLFGQREAILEYLQPLFHALQYDYRITHLYVHLPDGTNYVRAHEPHLYGDRITRHTLMEAARTGFPSIGLELGPFGTLTLRTVHPWFGETGELLGYFELGEEVAHILRHLHHDLRVELFILLNKAFLDRDAWEQGARMLGREPDWDLLPDTVLLGQQLGQESAAHIPLLAERAQDPDAATSHSLGGRNWRVASLPLSDAGGRNVGELAIVADYSEQTRQLYRLAVWVVSLGILMGGGVWLLCWGILYQIENRLQRVNAAKTYYEEIARRDSLTGLYTQKEFYALLELEIERARRYGHELCLMMLDIDHFKQVNDTWGHQTGDLVLRQTTEIIRHHIRPFDELARYGGEEFALIVPHTAMPEAKQIAERIRQTVAAATFFVAHDGVHNGTLANPGSTDSEARAGPEKSLRVTLSIGVSTCSPACASPQAMVAAADRALYRAKHIGRNRVVAAELPELM